MHTIKHHTFLRVYLMSVLNNFFHPLKLASGITLRNRIVMSPMTTWSGTDDFQISDEEEAYYRLRVKGVGLVVSGCAQVTPNGIGFTHEFSAADDSYIPSLKRLADAAKSGGAPAILQLFHAGNKALPQLIPNADVVSSSAIMTKATPFMAPQTPRALAGDEVLEIIKAFGEAARRGIEVRLRRDRSTWRTRFSFAKLLVASY